MGIKLKLIVRSSALAHHISEFGGAEALLRAKTHFLSVPFFTINSFNLAAVYLGLPAIGNTKILLISLLSINSFTR